MFKDVPWLTSVLDLDFRITFHCNTSFEDIYSHSYSVLLFIDDKNIAE